MPKALPPGIRRGPWAADEDRHLVNIVGRHGASCWVNVASTIGTRSAKQCRERFHQNLKPGLNHDPITEEEGILIEKMVGEMGKRWAEIARSLVGRSDNAVKNWWNGSQNRRKRAEKARRAMTRARLRREGSAASARGTPSDGRPDDRRTVTPDDRSQYGTPRNDRAIEYPYAMPRDGQVNEQQDAMQLDGPFHEQQQHATPREGRFMRHDATTHDQAAARHGPFEPLPRAGPSTQRQDSRAGSFARADERRAQQHQPGALSMTELPPLRRALDASLPSPSALSDAPSLVSDHGSFFADSPAVSAYQPAELPSMRPLSESSNNKEPPRRQWRTTLSIRTGRSSLDMTPYNRPHEHGHGWQSSPGGAQSQSSPASWSSPWTYGPSRAHEQRRSVDMTWRDHEPHHFSAASSSSASSASSASASSYSPLPPPVPSASAQSSAAMMPALTAPLTSLALASLGPAPSPPSSAARDSYGPSAPMPSSSAASSAASSASASSTSASMPLPASVVRLPTIAHLLARPERRSEARRHEDVSLRRGGEGSNGGHDFARGVADPRHGRVGGGHHHHRASLSDSRASLANILH